METILNVSGMSCSHCENAVKNALLKVEGVDAVSVSLSEATVTVSHSDSVTFDTLKEEIEEQGYDVNN